MAPPVPRARAEGAARAERESTQRAVLINTRRGLKRPATAAGSQKANSLKANSPKAHRGAAARAQAPTGSGQSRVLWSAAQARCEDTSAPEAVEGGENGSEEAFVCEDGSEPSCAGGLVPVVSSDGMQLLCEAATREKHTS